MFQNRCHFNAYQNAYETSNTVVAVLVADQTSVFVHFINQNRTTKDYIDNTFGYKTSHFIYYLLPFSVDLEQEAEAELLKVKREVINWIDNRFLKWWYQPDPITCKAII